MLAFIGGLGWQETLVILLIILLLFGARRLPELARSLGQGVREFRKSMKEISEEPKDSDSDTSGKSS